MTYETRVIDGQTVLVMCEFCPVCGEYQERLADTGEYIKGRDCGH